MKTAPLIDNEIERLEILHSTNLLDSEQEQVFDAITHATAKLCAMPLSFICLVDTERVWFKSAAGMEGVAEIPRKVGFCPHTITQENIFEVKDATKDSRFRHSPLVINEPYLQYYVGVPLITHDGYALGTLCVMDYQANYLDESKKQILKDQASIVISLIEAKRIRESLTISLTRKLNDLSKLASNEVYLISSHTNKFVYANQIALANLDYSLEKLKQLHWSEIFYNIPDDISLDNTEYSDPNSLNSLSFEALNKRSNGSTYPVESAIELCFFNNDEHLIISNDISNKKTAQERYKQLTSREKEVMKMLIKDQAKLTNKQVAENMGISKRTVEVHRRSIMLKTQAHNRTELVELARACNLI